MGLPTRFAVARHNSFPAVLVKFVTDQFTATRGMCGSKEAGLSLGVTTKETSTGHLEPKLTTVSRSAMEQGALAASLLAERLSGPEPTAPRHCVLEPQLFVRDSCCPPIFVAA